MTARGDINGPYARRSKEYIWSTLSAVFPRGISPTDVDWFIECNRRFFLFEGKTWGATMPDGQRIALQRMLLEWRPLRAVLVIGEHPSLDAVCLATGITTVQWWWNDGSDPLHVQTSAKFPNVLDQLQRRFYHDTQVGDLDPAAWERDIARMLGRATA